jgi:glycosyltransferase involved in cell wall biosynthesis
MIVILIAAYNEALGLEKLLPALPQVCMGHTVYLVVVSDGSTDSTADVARTYGAQVVELRKNRGKGAALRAGLQAIEAKTFDAVVLMDGDGQHDVADLDALVAPVLAGDVDLICGSRYRGGTGRGSVDEHPNSPGRVPLNRYVIRRSTVALLRRLRQDITDPFSGYRVLARDVALSWRPQGDRYQAELELFFDALLHGWTLREVPILRIYAPGCSKMGAHRGPLLGRLEVLRQYGTTLWRKSLELTYASTPAGVQGMGHGEHLGDARHARHVGLNTAGRTPDRVSGTG